MSKKYTIIVNGQALYSTWVRSYWGKKMYMADGKVFSRCTGKQLPYTIKRDVRCVEVC